MDYIIETLGLDKMVEVFDAVKNLLFSCAGLIAKCFSWLGPEFLIILTTGIIIAIILRIAGR